MFKLGWESESESCSVVSDSLQHHGLYSLWNFPGQNTGVGSHSLLQGIFPTQESNPGIWHCRWILYHLSQQGSWRKAECQRTDAFKLWCWRRLFRVPLTSRSNQSILRKINAEYSLEGLILKLKASLMAQLVKNPSAMQKTPVWFLGWEDPLEKGKATHSTIPAWRIPWTV